MSGRRALVVEDDPSWRQILAEILIDAGLAVDHAWDLDEAVAQMRREAHALAVVDLSLGSDPHNQDGLRALDGLRRFDPQCKAILISGFATVELAVSAIIEYGAVTSLRKETFNRAEFSELVRRILASVPPRERDSALRSGRQEGARSSRVSSEETQMDGEARGEVLVVEDDAGWQNILAELLTDAGYRVRVCRGFGEALGCLRRARFVLAVIDLSLTGAGSRLAPPWEDSPSGHDFEEYQGYRLLASARAGGIPTIVVSGFMAPEEIERVYVEQGIFAFLQKQTFNRQAFLQTVEEALATGATQTGLELLTEREREVVRLLAQGRTNKEIADALVISTNTVKRHLKAIFDKLQVHTRSAAAAKAIGRGVPGERA